MRTLTFLFAAALFTVGCQNRDTYDLPGHVPIDPAFTERGQGNPNRDYEQGFRLGKRDGRRGYQDIIVPPGNATFQQGYRDGFEAFHPGG